jgi:dTDP-4-amino-4,6-dideoxygalactose transaminase
MKSSHITSGDTESDILSPVTRTGGTIGTFMGRDALALAASFLDLNANDSVLLPAYTCQEVVRPFAKKSRIVFYDVQPNSAIDPDEIRNKLRTDRIKMVLIINYFGFLQPHLKEIKEICANYGIPLIEDCAHSLLTEGSGKTGDLSIFSFRKILPVSDGGGLKVDSTWNDRVFDFYPRIYSNVLSAVINTKSFLKLRGDRFNRASVFSNANNFVSKPTPSAGRTQILPLSSFSRNRISEISLSDVIRRRREDYQFWQEQLWDAKLIRPLFSDLPPSVCPLGFAATMSDRDSFVSRVRSQGVGVSIYWRLPSNVPADCKVSHKISTQILALPVYPALGPRERTELVRALGRG